MKGHIKNAWYVACWSDELPEGKSRGMSILGESIVLWRSSGKVNALQDRCIHRLAPLSLGRCEGSHLRCMYHGFLFDAEGQVVQIPGQDAIPPNARVRRYAAVEKHSWIWVWMGEAENADESLIPPAVGDDDPDWILGHGHLDYRADAQLINDNLLDFSHLTYVHAKSFGAGAAFAEERPKLTALPRGVRFERWIVGTTGPVGRRTDAIVDGWSTYDFLIPGVLLMWSGSFPSGTARECDYAKPDYSRAISGVTFTSQAVTPMADRSSRYFFSWGPHVKHGDAQLRDVLMGVAGQAFAEDKTMIEAQQQVIDRTPQPRILPTVHDRGVTIFTNLVNRLAREEEAARDRASQT